jgi:uncharacterized protein (DUF302 family)
MITYVKTVASKHSVAATIERIEHAVTARGMKLFARIDQAAEAAQVGLTMPAAILLLFGNPRAGTPLMIASPTAALDLPLKALAWEDASGEVWLSYNEPGLLGARHALPDAALAPLAPVGALLEAAASDE